MRKTTLIPIIVFLSVALNISCAITCQMQTHHGMWLFPEIGPSIVQDSYYIRAPGVESPFGIIGDIPGGYSLYTGSPLQVGEFNNQTYSQMDTAWIYGQPTFDYSIILLGVLFTVVPVSLILLLGRRSYGSTKTR